MTDTFHSAEITPNGISVKVGTHRRAIGLKDYASKAEFTAAVAALLADTLGEELALVAANVAAAETDATAAVESLKAEHASEKATLIAAHADEKAALQADIDALGTKEEAQAIRKLQAVAQLQAEIAAKSAELAKLMPAELEPADEKL